MVKVKLDAPSGNELPQKDLMLTLDFKHQPQTVLEFKFR
jgi:hypothetical protein